MSSPILIGSILGFDANIVEIEANLYRAYDHILIVSRTIADLAGEKDIKSKHLSEVIQFRSLDRQLWLG